MPLQYIKSQKGRDQLLHKGYLHKKERACGDKIFWKCADYHKYPCPGRAHTCEDRVVKYSPHLHPPNKTIKETKRVVHGATEMAFSSQKPSAHKGIPANREALPGESAIKKPRVQNNPKQTIQRLRECLNATRLGSSHLQASTAVAQTAAEEKPLPPPPAILPKASNGLAADGISQGASGPCNSENGSHSAPYLASQEAALQQFRLGSIAPGETPQEILCRLTEAARQWLNPQDRNKDQIIDMVILEQFLKVLPGNMQTWVKARQPGSCREAVQLAEAFSRDQEPADSEEAPMSFEDISVHFTAEEWPMLSSEEKRLYWSVMHQNYDNVAWLAGDGGGGRSQQEDPWLEVFEPVAEISGSNENSISQGSKEHSMGGNHLAREQNSSIGMNERASVSCGKGLTKPHRAAIHPVSELGMEKQHISVDGKLTAHVKDQQRSIAQGAEPVVLSEHLPELPEIKKTQKPRQNLVREDQSNVEKEQSNHSAQDKKGILSINCLWDPIHHVTRSVQGSEYKSTDASNLEDTLIRVSSGEVHSRENLESRAFSGEVCLARASEGISQNPDHDYIHLASELRPPEISGITDLEHDPLLDYFHVRPTEISDVSSQVSGCKITALVSKDQNVLGERLSSNSGNENEQEMDMPCGSDSQGPSKHSLPLDVHPRAEAHPGCLSYRDQNETPLAGAVQTVGHEEDPPVSPKCRPVLDQSPQSVHQLNCCDSAKSSRTPLSLLKHKRYDRRKHCARRNIYIRSVLGARWRGHPRGRPLKCLDWEHQQCCRCSGCRFLQPGEDQKDLSKSDALKLTAKPPETLHPMEVVTVSPGAESFPHMKGNKHQLGSSSSPLPLDSTAVEPTLAQLMSVLQQVATDTVEIKSAISALCATITGIQSALGSLSGCSDEAEHRISSLEDTSRNTKAQLAQHCNDIKAIEAKLIAKTVQTNVIAGLWSSLKVRRRASPSNLSPSP